MLIHLTTYTTLGLQTFRVDVEIDAGMGLPAITIVGLPDQTVKEARERVRTAIQNSGFRLPNKRFTINLAPADLKKEGGIFDLSIAVGLLAACRQIDANNLDDYIFIGELALDGRLRPVAGVLPIALHMKQTQQILVLPEGNSREAALVDGIRLLPCVSLYDLAMHLNQEKLLEIKQGSAEVFECPQSEIDFADVKSQPSVKRALEVAVAGNHHTLLVGPPGSGKTMLAQRTTTLLPPLSSEEALETASIHSIAGLGIKKQPLFQRPFRSPHHTISHAALVGGGPTPRPGEVSLAHNGILFLDEFPEFRRDALESLREPLEEGTIRIARAKHSLQYPAHFMLIAAMNPCPCGKLTDPQHRCRCNATQIQRYLAKISGPLLDRIDLHVDVPPVCVESLQKSSDEEPSSAVRQRISDVRSIQTIRYRSLPIRTNAELRARDLHPMCPMTPAASSMLAAAIREFQLSARSYAKILKISRTIADLDASNRIHERHLAEAIHYRSLDRQLWA